MTRKDSAYAIVAQSLGAGLQSTAMLLMANHGELPGPPVDVAIFADTGWETESTYEHLTWLEKVSEIPIVRVSGGNIRKDLGGSSQMPVFVPGSKGAAAQLRRQCTGDYKIMPIRRHLRGMLGAGVRDRIPPGAVIQQIGISLDEVERMSPSDVAFIETTWPLVEKRMTRHDCAMWLVRHGYPIPPKSSCIGCPFHSDAHWRQMRDLDPKSWADAVAADNEIRHGLRLGGSVPAFLHRSLRPLDLADLSIPEDAGQLNLFQDECSGHCGV